MSRWVRLDVTSDGTKPRRRSSRRAGTSGWELSANQIVATLATRGKQHPEMEVSAMLDAQGAATILVHVAGRQVAQLHYPPSPEEAA